MRSKLILPSKFLDHTFKIPVRITDINYGNHLGNHSLVEIIHEARMQFLQLHNYTELNVEGTGLIMADITVEFKSESFYGDLIEVQIACREISKVSFELFYKLSVNRNNIITDIAIAKTRMVCYDYALKKVISIPERFKKILLQT